MTNKLDPSFDFGSESGEDTALSTQSLETHLDALRERIVESKLPPRSIKRAGWHLDEAQLLLELERNQEAWQLVRPLFGLFIADEYWQMAAEACQLLSECDHVHSMAALANGIWIAVTFPIEPQATLALLQLLIEETPDDADGAAVAAATAKYIVDLRSDDQDHEDMSFFAMQMMGAVARRHSNIEGQTEFDAWVKRLELDDPTKFLVRLRNVLDVMAQDQWWVDRDTLRTRIAD